MTMMYTDVKILGVCTREGHLGILDPEPGWTSSSYNLAGTESSSCLLLLMQNYGPHIFHVVVIKSQMSQLNLTHNQ